MVTVMPGGRRNRKSHVLHRVLNAPPSEISHGRGIYLFDADGRRYLDACGGAAVSCLGHSDPDVIRAVTRQMEAVEYVHSSFFTSRVTEALADKVVALAGPQARGALFFNSGSEAMEAALKMARQYHLEKGETSRTHIISRRFSYHGTTLGALGIGGLTNRQEPFSEWLMGGSVSQVGACYPYRYQHEGESEQNYSARLVQEMETEILRLGPDNVAAIVAETVAGATLGVVPPTVDYFSGIRDLCDRYGILLVLDEVMCGMGRCGNWFAYQAEQIVPDIVCVAKGLGGGYQPIGAMIVNQAVYDAIADNRGIFLHGQTYMGHATACAAAMAVINKIEQNDLVSKVSGLGETFQRLLNAQFADHPHVGQIRGRGFFQGIELVSDRQSKTPFPSDAKLHQAIKRQAMENDLLIYAGGGALANGAGDHVLIAPPYISTMAQLEEISARLFDSINGALNSLHLN